MNERELTKLYRQWDPDPQNALQTRIRTRMGDTKTPFPHRRWAWAAVCLVFISALTFAALSSRAPARRLPQELLQRNASHYAYYQSLPMQRDLDGLNAADFPYYHSLGEQI